MKTLVAASPLVLLIALCAGALAVAAEGGDGGMPGMVEPDGGVDAPTASSPAPSEVVVPQRVGARVETEVSVQVPDVPVKKALIQGVYAGYRGDRLGERLMHGFALRVLWARSDSNFEVEFVPARVWGSREDPDERFGQYQLSLGVRYVLNKPGPIRPYVVAAPVFSYLTIDDTVSGKKNSSRVTGQVGVGLEVDIRSPFTVSFDVRAQQGLDVSDFRPSGFELLVNLAVGLYFWNPPPTKHEGTTFIVPTP